DIFTTKISKPKKHTYTNHMKKLYSKGIRLSELMEKWRRRKRGYFALYTKEGKRFVLPLDYLNHPMLQVLLEMAEDEFGTTIDGPLKIPCDGSLLDHIIMLVRRSKSHDYGDVEKKSSTSSSCKGASISSLFRGQSQIQSLVS
ncbi:unnamed protein product, partial [Arabidopsis halleri]